MPPLPTPGLADSRLRSSSRLRRNERSGRVSESLKVPAQSSVVTRVSISEMVMPEAYRPPISEPMLVPAMQSIGTPRRSSSLITETWAMPRAPPPPRARPMRGRLDPGSAWRQAIASSVMTTGVSVPGDVGAGTGACACAIADMPRSARKRHRMVGACIVANLVMWNISQHNAAGRPPGGYFSLRQFSDAADSVPDSMDTSKPRRIRYLSVISCPVPAKDTP